MPKSPSWRRVLPIVDVAIDVFAPTLVYLALTWTDLPASVRLSIGGFAVAAKGVARLSDVIDDPVQRKRFGLSLVVALTASLATVGSFEATRSEHWSIVVGALLLALGLVPLFIRGRSTDHVAMLVLAEITLSVVLTLISTSAFFILIRPAFYTAVAGIYVLATVGTADPFALRTSRMMNTHGDVARESAFDDAWHTSPRFRRTQRLMTASLGVTLLGESALRVIAVYTQPPEDVLNASLLSQLPGIVLFAAWFAGIKVLAKPAIEREVAQRVADNAEMSST